MAVHRDEPDVAKLVTLLRTMPLIQLAQCLAQVVDEMVADETPAEAVIDVCSEIRRHLGLSAHEMRQALH